MNPSDTNRSSIYDDLRTNSPNELDLSLNDQVSNESFEMMEKLCEMLDDERIKVYLPEFKSTDEEVEYILEMEKFCKKNKSIKCSTPDFSEECSTLDFSDECSTRTSMAPNPNDTLEEIDFILGMRNKLNIQEVKYLTPQVQKPATAHFIRNVETEVKLVSKMPYVNYRRGAQLFSPTANSLDAGNAFSFSPECRSQLLKSTYPEQFHRERK